jgi:DNA uptake protein ComE-like DNA-binding protein
MAIWAPFFTAGLPWMRNGEENGAVQIAKRSLVFALAMLGICLLGTAQNQDRDTRGLPKTSATAPPPEARIDINHAGVDELLKVPGMTRSWAGRIVRFRPYRTKQDLLEHGVVTGQVYDRIKDYVIAHREAQ